jgi:hypothetical protein
VNSLPSEDVGSKDGMSDGILKEEDDDDDGNNDGGDGTTDNCIGGADDEDDIFISLVAVDIRLADNGYIIGIILV